MTDFLIQRRITKKEREFIEKYKKQNNIPNDNQLLKLAIEELLGVNLADAKNPINTKLPLEYLTAYYFYEYMKKTYKTSPKNQKILDDSFKKWATGFWNIYTIKHNKKLDKANEMWDHFKTKRKVGRPKNLKKKRGRTAEKEKGYGT